jgi:ribosomal protein L11 methyltransferase
VSGKVWHAVAVTVSRGAREATEYGLMEAGALGTETHESIESVRVLAYFSGAVNEGAVRDALREAFRVYGVDDATMVSLDISEVADRDWLSEWKQNWQPVEVGRFIIAPPWSVIKDNDEHIVIRIEPGMAFGTGTHETTRLCLKAIDKHFRGRSFLDVGTGTGILAIAAAKLHPEARLDGLDTDAEAIEIAGENARLNHVEQINFAAGSVDEQTQSADLVCANLTAPVIVKLLPSLVGATCGRLVLSGVLDSQLELVQSRLRELSITGFEVASDGEWIAIVI